MFKRSARIGIVSAVAWLLGCGGETSTPSHDGSGGTAGVNAASGGAGAASGDCEYAGQTFADGSSFPAEDGCNQCSCDDDAVLCTLMACAPDGGSGGGGVGDSGTGGAAEGTGGLGGASLVTGRPCATADDCGSGYDCFTDAPGGYCLPGAPGGPTACREPESPCPAGTTCSPLPWHQISGVCLRTCSTAADCRGSYVCDYVGLFPGDPGTPRSADRVCWTVCQVGADQSCNDDSLSSALHGTCEPDGTCTCHEGFEKNPETGRCL